MNNADGVAGAIGVAGRGTAAWDDDEIQNGESLTLSFGAPVSEANFGFAKLDYNLSAGHQIGLWVAFLNGVEVGRNQFSPTDTTRTGTVQVKDTSGNSIAFDQISFEPAKQGSDYVITSFSAVRRANNAEPIGANWYARSTVYSGTSTTVLKSSVSDFAVYQWRVRACNSGNICSSWITTNEVAAIAGDGSSASSMRSSSSSMRSSSSAMSSSVGSSSMVTGMTATYSATPHGLKISWLPVPNALRYEVVRSVDGGITWENRYSSSPTHFVDTDIENHPSAIYYRVRACSNVCADWSSSPVVQ